MKRHICISLAVMAVLLTFAESVQADRLQRDGRRRPDLHVHRGSWEWAPALGLGLLGLGLWWEMTRPYYPPPAIIEQQPEIFVQPTPQPVESGFWYYCQDPEGYYPYVKECPGGWMKVVPSPPPPPEEE